jgi:hypothetical protein
VSTTLIKARTKVSYFVKKIKKTLIVKIVKIRRFILFGPEDTDSDNTNTKIS